MSNASFGVVVAAGLVFFATSPTTAQTSAKDVLEQYGVLGTFAVDCGKPVSPQNAYTFYRPIDADRVQIDLMVGPTERQYAYVIDRASGTGPVTVSISMSNEKQRLNLTYRVEKDRLRTVKSAREGGPVIIKGGRFVQNGQETNWINKCS